MEAVHGVDPGKFQKGVELGGRPPEAEACEIVVQFLTLSFRKFRI